MIDASTAFFQAFEVIWESEPLRIRFAYTFWVLLIFMYWYSRKYDEMRNATPLRDPDNKKTNLSYGNWLAFVLGVIPYFAVKYTSLDLRFAVTEEFVTILGVVGFCLLSIGFIFAVYGRVTLSELWGPNIYSYVDSDQEKAVLVQSKAYDWVRHPIYCGQIFMTIGTFLIVQSFYLALFPILVVIFSFVRATNEEKDLADRFGDDYRQYKNRVFMLIPWKPKPRAS